MPQNRPTLACRFAAKAGVVVAEELTESAILAVQACCSFAFPKVMAPFAGRNSSMKEIGCGANKTLLPQLPLRMANTSG